MKSMLVVCLSRLIPHLESHLALTHFHRSSHLARKRHDYEGHYGDHGSFYTVAAEHQRYLLRVCHPWYCPDLKKKRNTNYRKLPHINWEPWSL